MTYLEGAVYLVIAQLLVFAFLNLRSGDQPNRILAMILLVFVDAIRKSFIPLYIDGTYFDIIVLNMHSDMFYGPLIYMYLRSKSERIQPEQFVTHLAFPFLYVLFLIGLMLGSRTFSYIPNSTPYVNLFVTETRFLVFAIYLVASVLHVRTNSWKIMKHANRYFNFMLLIGSYLLIYYFNLFLIKYAYTLVISLQPWFSYFSYSIFLSSILYLVYYGATELNWLKNLFLTSNLRHPDKTKPSFEKIDQQLNVLFENEKIHLDREMNLSRMADLLEVRKEELSDYIRLKTRSNFYDLLNSWRIDEFKSKLADPNYQHLDMLGLAYESGFQSKATFNRAFKRIEQTTPREFKRKLDAQIAI